MSVHFNQTFKILLQSSVKRKHLELNLKHNHKSIACHQMFKE